MSMNLIFKTKDGVGYVDFPFQTPTKLTFDVLAEPDNLARLNLIKEQMLEWEWSEAEIQKQLSIISALMNSPHLKLTMI